MRKESDVNSTKLSSYLISYYHIRQSNAELLLLFQNIMDPQISFCLGHDHRSSSLLFG
jgi:hypothetical protein